MPLKRCEWYVKKLKLVPEKIPGSILSVFKEARRLVSEEPEKAGEQIQPLIDFEMDFSSINDIEKIIDLSVHPVITSTKVRCYFEADNDVPLLSVSVLMDVHFLSDITDEELRDWQDNHDEIGNAGYFDFGEESLDSDEGIGFHIIND